MASFLKSFGSIFTADFHNRAVCFIVGAAFTYALTNPDDRNTYDVFPVVKQNKFAYITYYTVPQSDAAHFEEKIKSVYRFLQQQKGYLFTKLIKSVDVQDGKYEYISLNTWINSDFCQLSYDRPIAKQLFDEVPGTRSELQLNKILVDDTEYNPID